MSMYSRWRAIPDILRRKLLLEIFLIVGILTVGILMEHQNGNGFLQLSCLCSIGLGIRFFYLLWIVCNRKYEEVVGEVIRIQKSEKQKKYWEIIVRDLSNQERTMQIAMQSNIQKGLCYRFYWKGDELLGIEENWG